MELKLDIMGISKANLENNTDEHEFKIDGYNVLKSGGNINIVVCYINNNICYNEQKKLDPNLSNIWIEIGKGVNKWVICVIYR